MGLRPGVSVTEGVVCEFLLNFLSCVVILMSIGERLTFFVFRYPLYPYQPLQCVAMDGGPEQPSAQA